jgi:hypothetical protein
MPTRIFLFSNKLAPKPPNYTNSIRTSRRCEEKPG